MSHNSRPRTVAVDVNPASRSAVTGTEIFTRELCARLPATAPEIRWRFYASRPCRDLGIDVTVAPFRRLWSQIRLPAAMASARPDLLFVPAHAIPFGWPGRTLTVVHDLAFERCPLAYTRTSRTYLQLSTRLAARRCPLLIAVSESTKRDLIEVLGVPDERIRVVALGVAPAGAPAAASRLTALGIEGSFVLQVGRIEPRKNQLTALAGVERLSGVTLVVAGAVHDAAMAERLHASGRCRVLGPVDNPMLELLYQQARAVVVPSLYEGFGLPVLEAMARGNVVVAARNSSLPEVGGDAAMYFDDALDVDQLSAALNRALTDEELRANLVRAGRDRARSFTWSKTAQGVADVIRELV
ncbi:MAG: glycosyltransferase family 4 protein [Candidatus Dormibacterales bacterium]